MNENELCTEKESAIISRLNLLGNKITQLRTKLSPVMMSIPRENVSTEISNKSRAMSILENIIEDVDEIRDTIDI